MEKILLLVTIVYTIGVVIVIGLNIRYMKKVKETKRIEVESRLSYYDRVNGLASMTMFKDNLAYSTSKPKEKDPLSVLAVSLDLDTNNLDEVQMGILLKSIVLRMKDCLRATDFVTMAGDGTFYIMLTRISSETSIGVIANRLIGVFKNHLNVADVTILATPYIGVAIYPDENMDLDNLISGSNTAMKQLKDSGKSGYHIYIPTNIDRANMNEILVSDLRGALKNNEFVLHYQPQLSLDDRRISGVEALIRWNHPKRGLIYPDSFIDIAENSNFMEELTSWVVREACKQHRAWGIPNLKMSVNISAAQFRSKKLIDQVETAVRLTAMNPKNLNLEITETVSIADKEFTMEILKKFKERGFLISIDDFGVGQSSLSYVKDFPIDYIKLDRSFIKDLSTNSSGEVVMRSVITLAKALNIKVVAEGVEEKEHLDFLLHEGCNEIQGYYISKPLTPEEFASRIDKDYFKTYIS